MMPILYIYVCVDSRLERAGWKITPRPKTVILLIKISKSLPKTVLLLIKISKSLPKTVILLIKISKSQPKTVILLIKISKSQPKTVILLIKISKSQPKTVILLIKISKSRPITVILLLKISKSVSQYPDMGLTIPRTPDACHSSHCSTSFQSLTQQDLQTNDHTQNTKRLPLQHQFSVTDTTGPANKSTAQSGIEHRPASLKADAFTTRPTRRSSFAKE